MIIYTITNLINNKIYVGCTINKFSKRKNSHISKLKNKKHSNQKLQNSFNLHGIENFQFDILEEYPLTLTTKELKSIENWWINILNTYNSNFGYNISCPEKENEIKNYSCSKEFKRKCSERLKGKKPSINASIASTLAAKPILQYAKNGNFINEFINSKKAAIVTGFKKQNIQAAANGNQLSSNGFMWRYKENENYPLKIQIPDFRSIKPKRIIILDVNFNILNIVDYINQIKEVNKVCVNKCLKNYSLSCKGYRFIYEKDKKLLKELKTKYGENHLNYYVKNIMTEEILKFRTTGEIAKLFNFNERNSITYRIKNKMLINNIFIVGKLKN